MQRIPFTALDKDPAQVEVVRRYGGRVYYGDPTRLDVLRAAGAEGARVLVLAPCRTRRRRWLAVGRWRNATSRICRSSPARATGGTRTG